MVHRSAKARLRCWAWPGSPWACRSLSTASGGCMWRRSLIGRPARNAGVGRRVTAVVGWRCGICPWPAVRWCCAGPSGSGICSDPDCAKKTWSETSEAIGPKAVLTERAAMEICRRVGEDGDSVAEVARAFGVGWHTAMAAVRVHGRPKVDDPGPHRRHGGVGHRREHVSSRPPPPSHHLRHRGPSIWTWGPAARRGVGKIRAGAGRMARSTTPVVA